MTHSLQGIGSLVAFLPYEFGFAPQDSLVLVGLRARQIQVSARLDLPDVVAGDLASMLQPIRRAGLDDVAAFVLEPRTTSAVDDALHSLERHLREQGCPVTHIVHVDRGRWWAQRCRHGCCTGGWHTVPDCSRVPAVADRVLQGVAPAVSRDHLAAELRSVYPLQAAAVRSVLRRGVARDDETAIATMLLGDIGADRLPADLVAAATHQAATVEIRDAVLGWLVPELLELEVATPIGPRAVDAALVRHTLGPPLHQAELIDHGVVAARLITWIRSVPPEAQVPLLLFLAALKWGCGEWAMASIALERAQTLEPDCRLAALLSAALRHGLRPGDHREPRSA